MSLICEESHLCFGKEPEAAHGSSHLCFGRRYRPQLDPLEAHVVASVLEDAISQLAILGMTLPEPPDRGDCIEDFRDVDARFGRPPPSPRTHPEMAGRWSPRTEAMLKVQRDRQFAETVLDRLLLELREKGSFGSLRAALDWQGAMIADEQKLLEQREGGRESRRQLVEQLASDRKNMRRQRDFWDEKTEYLTSNLHDAYLLGGLTISYADAWERNRREQQGLVFSRKEDALHDAIEHIQEPEGPNEERVHAEIMNFLSRDTEILKKDLDHWTDLYDAEMVQRETENMQLRNLLEQQREEHKELKEEEWQRKEIIENAAVLRAGYEEKQKTISHVVAIQAWWRGVSYRAGISMGKPKKGKKKKKKRVKKSKSKKVN